MHNLEIFQYIYTSYTNGDIVEVLEAATNQNGSIDYKVKILNEKSIQLQLCQQNISMKNL